jgi:flagellar biosynthetic protein FlhB
LAALVVMQGLAGRAVDQLFQYCFGNVDALIRGDRDMVIFVVGTGLLFMVLPVTLAATFGSIIANVLQKGLHFYPDNISFDLSRLNPLPRLQELFKPVHASKELMLAVLRVVIIGSVAYNAVVPEIPRLLALTVSPLNESYTYLVDLVFWLIVKVLAALIMLAAIDYLQSYFEVEKEMKMTMQEIKEEQRAQDGDPKVKGRLRARARQMAKQRMMQGVKQADVIVTNPTHISVALRYAKTDVAPVVIAKGHDEDALQIRAEARRYSIPIVENRPLARALDAEVRIGQIIPGQHFQAVAQVLAFVFKLKSRYKKPEIVRRTPVATAQPGTM